MATASSSPQPDAQTGTQTGTQSGAEAATVDRLRTSVTRLTRLLRQQDRTDHGPTLTAMLATVAAQGPLTLGDLATREQVSPPTVTKVVDRLEVLGLVERLADLDDRRVRRVALTPAGREHLDGVKTRRTAWLADRVDELTDDERSRLDAALDVLERLALAPDRARATTP